ncbi:MAG TPA: HD domain-containing phosphohydrolase [Verrucomicrobiae bacterium]|nr:HD domain-containing phosphohydrolase [Verrucomicrobiae bacterium]
MADKGYIICVDDDLALLETLWQQILDLTSATHEVVMAKSAEEALSMIYQLHHDGKTVEMLITDLIMPGMSGDRLLEIVNARFPVIVKILLTGHTGLDSALYCINNANLDKYISKPWQMEDLHMTVSSLLRQFRLRRDNQRLLEDLQLRNLQLKGALRELRNAQGQVESAYMQTLQSLAAALDAKDPYTAGHSERVARWAAMIGRRLQLPREDIEDIRAVALLHDIGKIGLPEKILNKPGRLSSEEMDMVRMHPIIGAQILGPIVSFARYVPIVRHHHEWYNGSGYPDRLGGADLPLAVWVTALADAFDAITSNRPYRKGQTLDFAFGEMIGGMSSQFHPDCVRLFVEVLQEPGFSFEEAIRLGAGRRRREGVPEPLEAAMQHLVESGGVARSCCAMMQQYGALDEASLHGPHTHEAPAGEAKGSAPDAAGGATVEGAGEPEAAGPGTRGT